MSTALRHAEADAATLASRLGVNGTRDGQRDGRRARASSRRASTRSSKLLASGNTGEEVAEQLGISPATVRVHVRNATGKLGASTRTQAVAIAVARGEVAAP